MGSTSDEIMRQAANPYPNIHLRMVLDRSEAYLADSGLAIWEIAWLGREYGNDAGVISEHTLVDRASIAEGLRYASEHRAEVDAQVAFHTERSLDDLLTILPGMRVLDVASDVVNGSIHLDPAYPIIYLRSVR